MYFEDLTIYSYYGLAPLTQVRNVGWLEEGHSFRTGITTQRVSQLLEEYYPLLVANRMRGRHNCTLCPSDMSDPYIESENKMFTLGSAELWIPAESGVIFSCPELVIHYLREHAYCPPDEFVTAVLRLPMTIAGWNGDAEATKLCGY